MSPAPPSRPRRRAPAPDSEEAFDRVVTGLARFYGFLDYHTHDSRRSAAGFPDRVFLKAPRLILAELKAQKATRRATVLELAQRPEHLRDPALTQAQARWLEELELVEVACRRAAERQAAADHADTPARVGVEVYLWRPSDIDTIVAVLAGADGNIAAGAAFAHSHYPPAGGPA